MRYHINSKGVPAICKAKVGNCPFGDDDKHFNSLDEAQLSVDKAHASEHGILPGLKMYLIANKQEEFDYIDSKKKYMIMMSDGPTYLDRCRRCERLNDYKPLDSDTLHYKEDRQEKAKGLYESIGEGNLIGYYEVDHLVKGRFGGERYREQVVELRDNGILVVYDKESGRTITTFVGHPARVESMMLIADEIPSPQLMDNIIKSKLQAAEDGYDN